MNNTKLIQLININKSYYLGEEHVPVLRDVTLQMEKGEYIAILGPSGSGKSTLMHILGCLDTPSSGQYFLTGRDISQLTVDELAEIRNRQIGFVFQSFHLLPYASTLDNVALPLVYRGIPAAERQAKAIYWLERVGLGDRTQHKPNQLSGGQRQRVAIARALVTNPDIILADEPTGNLDSHSGAEVIKLFEQFVADGKTIIIVTHDQQLAERTKRIIRIHDGTIIQNT
ncbi:MAG: ABC transporter ATP-binding protein [Gammaproteobacteria bacterium]